MLGLVGWQQQWHVFNAGLNAQFASPDFTELGYSGLPAPSTQIAADVGAYFGHGNSAALTYVDQDNVQYGHVRLLTASYNVGLFSNGFLNVIVFHTLGGASNNGATITFAKPFGERSNGTAGVERQNHLDHAFAQVQESLPAGTGTLTLNCTSGSGITLVISLSQGSSGSYAARTLKNGTAALNYNLYTTAAYTTVWGNGTGSTQTVSMGSHNTSKLPVSATVYGSISALQNAVPGAYTDSITATVTF